MDSAHHDHGTESAPSAHCSQQTTEKAATMATTPIIGHKRTHSQVESEGASAEATASKPTTQLPPRALLMHLSTLLSCKKAIVHTVRATLPQVLPDSDIPVFTDEDVLRAFSRTPMVNRLMCRLAGRNLTVEENARLRECYPRIYYQVGAPLLTLAPHAKELLKAVKRRDDIALAVVSSNPDEAVGTLIKLGIRHLVDAILPALPAEAFHCEGGNSIDYFHDNWTQQVTPWFTKHSRAAARITTIGSTTTIIIDDDDDDDTLEINIKPLLPAQAMFVSCCLYDLCVAKAGGAQTCWIRKIGADDPATAQMSGAFNIMVEELDELRVKLFEEGEVEKLVNKDKDSKNKMGGDMTVEKEGGKNKEPEGVKKIEEVGDKNKVEGNMKMEENDKDKEPEGVKEKNEEVGDKDKVEGDKDKEQGGKDQVMGGIEQAKGVCQQKGAPAKGSAEAEGVKDENEGEGEDQAMEGVEGAGGADQLEGTVAKSPAEAEGGVQATEGAGQEKGGVMKAPCEGEQQVLKAPDADGNQVAKAADAHEGQVTKAADADGDQVMQTAQDDEVDMITVKVLE